jgi:hypothetical protein
VLTRQYLHFYADAYTFLSPSTTGIQYAYTAANTIFCSMKHDAIVEQGIPIHERVPIPEEMIPEDSRVEIDAKIQAGYCKSSNPSTPSDRRGSACRLRRESRDRRFPFQPCATQCITPELC